MTSLNDILSNPTYRQSAIKRINKKQIKTNDKNGCYGWIGSTSQKNYPLLSVGGQNGIYTRATRIIYFLEKGEFDEKLCVLHKCDNPICTNINHLFLGTNKDNTLDMISKNRQSLPPIHYGETHHLSKLTEDEVIKIFYSTNNISSLAREYKVSQITISRIKQKKGWKHITSKLDKPGRYTGVKNQYSEGYIKNNEK